MEVCLLVVCVCVCVWEGGQSQLAPSALTDFNLLDDVH